MASAFGENRGMVCAHCGLRYDDMRTGRSFKELRNEIISIGTDAKTGRTKYGRRNGVLGYWHELKMLYWDQHVEMCAAAVADAKKKRRTA